VGLWSIKGVWENNVKTISAILSKESKIKGVKINPDARMVVKDYECGALLVTGCDKIKSGYGNGDCLLLNLKESFFALSDSTERYSRASRDILERLCVEVDKKGVPENKEEWLDLVNDVFAAQKYHQKATFSLAAIKRTNTGTSICIINGGDSSVNIINKDTGRVEYRTESDMNFAGRSKGISKVMELSLKGSDYRLVMASDGLADVARFCDKDVTEMVGTFLTHNNVHEIPKKLRELIRAADLDGIAGNYDDIGVIVIDPMSLEMNCDAQIVMGGTTPGEEDVYQMRMADSPTNDGWITMNELPENTNYINMCGIRVR
jgi:hypothetical protein